MSIRHGLLLGLAVLFSLGCTGSPPEILFVDRELTLRSDPSGELPRETLRLFAAVRDGDGVEDISRVWVAHPESELVWELDGERWHTVSYGGDDWLGHPQLEDPRGASLPRGRYTVTVEDYAGSAFSTDFFITEPVVVDFPPFPRLLSDRDGLVVDSQGPVVVRAYSAAGDLVISRASGSGTLDPQLRSELEGADARIVYLYAESSAATGYTLISGPFELPPGQ